MEVSEKIRSEQISQKISEAIKCSGFTQTHLASLLGVSQQAVSAYVNCMKMPTLDTFANLCKILDVDPADILCINK